MQVKLWGKLYLTNHSKKFKPNHLNWGKLYLDQRGSKVLGDAFLKETSKIFNWHYIDERSRLDHEGGKSNFLLKVEKWIDVKTILKSIRRENTNKLVFAHIYISSTRNKFELLVSQVKRNMMISETKNDGSFPLGNFLMHLTG